MSFNPVPLKHSEELYTFQQNPQIAMQCGLIGFLRAEMDYEESGFLSTWTDVRKDIKSEVFKKEFDELLAFLRRDGNILHNRKAIVTYGAEHPESKMLTEYKFYGIRVDTKEYAYLFRLDPEKSECNVFCYCYLKEWLNNHLKAAKNGIRFITSGYEDVFRLPDGGRIRIRYPSGEEKVCTCRYIDEYHVELDFSIYHICQLAEIFEKNGAIISVVKEDTCHE